VRVVFDSNVYVSALAIPGGVAEKAMRAAMDGTFELVLSRPILVEVLGVLSRKFARQPEELARTALFLSSLTEIVAPVQRVQVLADGPDNRILECALAARADLVVTGDRQMLSLRTWEGIEILSLRQFVDRLGQGRDVRQSLARYQASGRPTGRSRSRPRATV
jgi:uncharacterized protein